MIKKIISERWAYLFLLPWAALFSIFIMYPFLSGFAISMTDFDFAKMKFVLFDNYITIFSDEIFIKSIFITIKLGIIVIPFIIIFSLWVSNLIINMKTGFQSFVKAGFYIPVVTSSVALVITWKWLFNPAYGLSTYLCNVIGIPSIDWYGVTGNAIAVIAVLLIVVFIGQPIILYSAAMGGIPASLYESAEIDGARGTEKFFKITFPLVQPTTLFILITTTIASLQVFEIPLLLTSGGPRYGTTTILYLLYKTAFEFGKFGLAASMGVVLFLIISVIALIQFKFFNSDIQY